MSPAADEVAAAVATVDGVASASADVTERGGTLRVVFAPGRPRDAVARAISDVLLDRFGLRVDPAAIERLADDEEPDVLEPTDAPSAAHDPPHAVRSAPRAGGQPPVSGNGHHGTRPRIAGLHLTAAGLAVTAAAVLTVDGREVTGTATGADLHRGRLTTVVRATLDALEQLLGGRAKLELESLELTDVADDVRVLVTLAMLTAAGAERLVGAAFVKGGEEEHAAMRATLDAVNRRVELLVTAPNGRH